MPKQSFALESGGNKRLEVSWSGMWGNTTILLDGKTIGVIPNQKALLSGQEFVLNDGSILKIQLINMFVTTELRILRNNQPLPGSSSDPQTRLKISIQAVYVIAGFNIILGAISLIFNVELLQQIGVGFGSIIYGLVFLVLGFFVQRKSVIALLFAIGVFALDSIATFFLSASQGYNTAGLTIVRIIILIGMFQGLGAIKTLKTKIT
ncbi:MAG: hypothetical protein U0Z26_17475 [Anaerolineales bacterium]